MHALLAPDCCHARWLTAHELVEESEAREDANEQRFDETCIFHGLHYLFLSLISAIVVIIILRDRTAGALRNSTNVRRESSPWVNFVGWEGEPLTDSPPAHSSKKQKTNNIQYLVFSG